jgi:hypothetical protein
MSFPPPDSRIKRVDSFHALATTPFADGINALCWERSLPGGFGAVAALLAAPKSHAPIRPTPPGGPIDPQPPPEAEPEENPGLTAIDPAVLLAARDICEAANDTRIAIDILLSDLAALRSIERDPVLNLIHGYPRDEDGGPMPTDVFSFHADSAPVPADTWLCTYHGPPSEGLRNEDAVRKVDLPGIRAELLRLHGGLDDAAFAEFLSDNHYDLHYAAVADAAPYSFGRFNLWRIACDYPGSPVPPCIHRAPRTRAGDPPRLLLIS